MIDTTIQRLLEQAIDSPIKLHLLLLFYENPRMQSTASQVAGRLYRDIWSTRQALQELAEDGVLNTIVTDGELLFCYQPRSELVGPIFRLVQSYNEPLERDQLVRLLRDIASYAPFRRAARGGTTLEWQRI